ncbi:DUF5703 domain-containing protein [Bacteroides stercorirosoris]|jgi:alpha-L-fucosidase 2|uniref:glycosyl hydrolase family 95 catalytic domain-containing protein n=1 Tax=Bacteroides stercorirosoris TaxID=871324 RepID=UPI000AE43CFB|nr:DUF5703 domain-containing protein [Bacteroides stercorirosoris]
MKNFLLIIAALFWTYNGSAQPSDFKNVWEHAPLHVPNEPSTDAPLMGNGDIGMCVGFERGTLRYYLTKNDFWRLQSKAEHLSGPRVCGYVDVKMKSFADATFRAEQSLMDGKTECTLRQNDCKVKASSWVAATENLITVTLTALEAPVEVELELNAPQNEAALVEKGESGGTAYLTRSFIRETDIPTMIAFAVRTTAADCKKVTLHPGEPVTLFIAFESKFKQKNPLKHVLKEVRNMNLTAMERLWEAHNVWWKSYWDQSSFTIGDRVLMKAYYQGLYTMGACSRDKKFPPALFGWVTTDKPTWNGDYHLNYNFYAPFYGLYGANRIEQATGQETPLLDFMPRGRWYAKQVTRTRGILYPVGIGPLGVEVTRDFPVLTDNGYTEEGDVEAGGLFYKQRSHALFGTVNMAQHWRHTYDLSYGKRIYPYVLAIADFWEDFLIFEDGQYQIYGDAENEKSGFSKNPGMSIALLKNALELAIELSKELKRDEYRQAKWQDIITHLRELPTWERKGKRFLRGAEEDERGRQVAGVSFSMIYPANGVTLDSDSALLVTGLNTVDAIQQWQHHNATSSFYPAAVRVGYAPEKIIEELRKYAIHTYPNGFQLDNPHGIENSCTVANTLNEMACMSVGNKIRLFTVWPKAVDASFEKIRTWGAFLVSASFKNGTVCGVTVFSEKGRSCTVVNPWKGKTVLLVRNGKPDKQLQGEELTFPTSVNETIVLKPL